MPPENKVRGSCFGLFGALLWHVTRGPAGVDRFPALRRKAGRRQNLAAQAMLARSMRRATILLLVAAQSGACFAAGQSDIMGERMPYDAFDALPKTVIKVDGGTLDVRFAPGEFVLPKSRLLAWLEKSAKAVSVYYVRFPVPETRVLVVPLSGHGVRAGTAFGYRGPAIRLGVGVESTEDDLQADWKAVHEMIHLALPDVTQDHLWLAEGLAVYIESIARVQAGHLPAAKIWHEFVRDVPQGLPKPTDGGLEGTTSWGRTYWGGAIFCLLADVELRKRSGNKTGLQDAMRGVVAAGGTHDKDWPIDRILNVADKSVGMTVLSELYEKMGKAAYRPDLKQLWSDLGIIDTPVGAHFDDRAPLADVRRAITSAPR
jgi:hypothetical protein